MNTPHQTLSLLAIGLALAACDDSTVSGDPRDLDGGVAALDRGVGPSPDTPDEPDSDVTAPDAAPDGDVRDPDAAPDAGPSGPVVDPSRPIEGRWIRMSGPTPPQVSAFVEHSGLWFLGTEFMDQGDVFVSRDGGQTWLDTGLPNGGVAEMLSHEGRLFVGGYLSGLFWSDDDGETWTNAGPPLDLGTAEALLALEGDVMIAGLDPFFPAPLYRSLDHGETWAPIEGSPELRCFDLARVDGVLLAGGDGVGAWRSLDGGASWIQVTEGLSPEASVYRFAVEGSTVLVAAGTSATSVEIYRSDDLGETWAQVSENLPLRRGQGASLLSFIEGALYLGISFTGGERGLFRSMDMGVTWAHLDAASPEARPSVRALAQIEGDLVVGTYEGALRSADGGETWRPSWLGAGGVAGGSAFMYAFDRLHVGVQSTGDATPYAMLSTPDLGATWSTHSASVPKAMLLHEGALYAGLYGQERGIVVSRDGEHYSFTDEGFEANPIFEALHAQGDALFAGTTEGLYRSLDEGASWTLLPDVEGWVSALTSLDGALYIGLYPGGVLRSMDRGETWTPLDEGLEAEVHVNALTIHDGAVHAGLNGRGVARWSGARWEPMGLEDQFINELASVDGVLLAGDSNGALWITAPGLDWYAFDQRFTGGIVEGIGVTPEHLVVGTRGRGFWLRPRADLAAIFEELADP